jgi:excisionase family DNA binding protein
MDNHRLLNVEEAAALLGLRPSTIRGMVQRKTIPVVRPAGKRVVRFRRSDVLRLFQSEYVGESPDGPVFAELSGRRPTRGS